MSFGNRSDLFQSKTKPDGTEDNENHKGRNRFRSENDRTAAQSDARRKIPTKQFVIVGRKVLTLVSNRSMFAMKV